MRKTNDCLILPVGGRRQGVLYPRAFQGQITPQEFDSETQSLSPKRRRPPNGMSYDEGIRRERFSKISGEMVEGADVNQLVVAEYVGLQ